MCEMIIQIIDIIVQAFAIIVSASISIIITNKQIRNQNKETYRPRLKVNSITNRRHSSKRSEYMVFSYYYKSNKEDFNSYISIELENIGNGLANDITFYDLIHAERCAACQSLNSESNQQIHSTEEVPKDASISLPFWVTLNRENILNVYNTNNDFALLICNYKDLNNNNYKLLIYYSAKKIDKDIKDSNGKMIKNACKIDFYYHQEETYHFKAMMEKYKENYEKIEKMIKSEDKILRK